MAAVIIYCAILRYAEKSGHESLVKYKLEVSEWKESQMVSTQKNLYFPLIFIYLFLATVFAIGLGWILAGLNVYLRDVQQMAGMILMGWFFFTPVFYSPGIVPEKVLPFMKLNPMYHVLEGYRLALLSGKCLLMPDFFYLTIISFLTFWFGGTMFKKLKPGFAEVL